jgi:hypothetical protein
VWADFGGTLGKVVDTAGTGINGAALKEAIRRGQIVTVHRGTDGTHPTLVVEQVENPADAGSSLTLDALKDVEAPAPANGEAIVWDSAAAQYKPKPVQDSLVAAVYGGARPEPWSNTATYRVGQHTTVSLWDTVAGAYTTKVFTATAAVGPSATPPPSDPAHWKQTADLTAVTAGGHDVPMDPKNVTLKWNATTQYNLGDLVWTEEQDGTRYYYSSDIRQTGGTAPSLTNLATWTNVSGRGILWDWTLVPRSVLSLLGNPRPVSEWQPQAYAQGNLVRYRYIGTDKYWIALRATTASDEPSSDPASGWEEVSNLGLHTLVSARWKKWTGTQAQYNAIPVKDPDTLYAITG